MLTEFQEYLRSIGKSQNTALGYCDKVRLYFKWCLDSFGRKNYKREIHIYSRKQTSGNGFAAR